MVLDFTDSKNSCYLKNLQNDGLEVSLARVVTGVAEEDVDRIVNNTSKFFRNLAHKVGLSIIGSGPSKTAICCSLGPNIQEMLCQNAQMQLVQYVKVENGYIEAKLVWFDELSSHHACSPSACTSDGASLQEIKSRRENFINLFNSSWTSLVKVVLGDGDKFVKFYHKTANGTLVPETVLKSSQKQNRNTPPSQMRPMYDIGQPNLPTRNFMKCDPAIAPQRIPQAAYSNALVADSLERRNAVLHRPLKRRRQEHGFDGQHYAAAALQRKAQTDERAFEAGSATQPIPDSYQTTRWRKALPQHIFA